MRFADVSDVLFRGGHLSDQALVDVCMSGERPVHLDRCDICATRAIDFGRWLDDVRAVGEADVEAVFPPERLAAQQAQIMRRLEQLDQPARVIAFPRHLKLEHQVIAGRRVAPGWVAVAAAAGLVVGVLGTQVGSHFMSPSAAPVTTQMAANAPVASPDPEHAREIDRVDQDIENGGMLDSPIDRATPRVTPAAWDGRER